MAEQIETLAQQLIHRVTTPFGLAILTGAACSSFSFFGALSLELDGVLPATATESERARKGISDTSALKMWEWMFRRGKKHFGSTTLLGGASYLVASAFNHNLRPILYGASFFSFAVPMYTLAIIMPINKEILKATSDASTPDGGKTPGPRQVDKLFSEWRKLSSIRTSLAAVSWGLGAAALLLA